MIEVHMRMYKKDIKMYSVERTYYLDVSEVVLYNYLNDKGIVESWDKSGRIALDVGDIAIILYVLEVQKTISLDQFANKIGV